MMMIQAVEREMCWMRIWPTLHSPYLAKLLLLVNCIVFNWTQYNFFFWLLLSGLCKTLWFYSASNNEGWRRTNESVRIPTTQPGQQFSSFPVLSLQRGAASVWMSHQFMIYTCIWLCDIPSLLSIILPLFLFLSFLSLSLFLLSPPPLSNRKVAMFLPWHSSMHDKDEERERSE